MKLTLNSLKAIIFPHHFFSRGLVVLAIGLLLMLNSAIARQDSGTTEIKANATEELSIEQKINHNFYLGAKLGLVYIFGIELNYIIQSHEINRFYMAAAVQSSLIVNSFNAGGGFFLGKTGIGVGCRYHHLLWFESEKESKIQPGYGPEVVWNRTIGTKYIVNLHAGGIITEGTFFPDISFGVFLPLNR